MESLLIAYIDLAKTSTETFQKSGRIKDIRFKELSSTTAVKGGRLFNECVSDLAFMPAVLTVTHGLKRNMDYSNVVTIASFSSVFSITENGISRPKIITCQVYLSFVTTSLLFYYLIYLYRTSTGDLSKGSDGKNYKQLVKGGDDMRQDAVMEQVFESVNCTLRRDPETYKRRLGIRTYKIIPTTPQTGVLEWVEDTVPFGSLLTDKETGLHSRYYPKDWTHSECRSRLKDAQDNADKETRFAEIYGTVIKLIYIKLGMLLASSNLTTQRIIRQLPPSLSLLLSGEVR